VLIGPSGRTPVRLFCGRKISLMRNSRSLIAYNHASGYYSETGKQENALKYARLGLDKSFRAYGSDSVDAALFALCYHNLRPSIRNAELN
jgi:hypothetical protein